MNTSDKVSDCRIVFDDESSFCCLKDCFHVFHSVSDCQTKLIMMWKLDTVIVLLLCLLK